MAYPTTAELVAESTVGELVSLTPEQQDALRDAAITAAENYTGQAFTDYDGEIEVEVEHGTEVYLPRRLRSFRSVTPVGGEPVDLTALRISDDGARIAWRPNIVGVGYYSQALFEVSGGDYLKEFPTGVLVIDGNWGWTNPPAAVRMALRFDMEDNALADANALTPSVNYARTMGLTRLSQGNLNVDLGPLPTLSPRVVRLLEAHVFLGRGGRLV